MVIEILFAFLCFSFLVWLMRINGSDSFKTIGYNKGYYVVVPYLCLIYICYFVFKYFII
jgi:Na+-driven multidrug efflux pump